MNNLNEKIVELENRIKALELYNKKMRKNKIITYIITIIFVIVIAIIYIYFISKAFNNYVKLF